MFDRNILKGFFIYIYTGRKKINRLILARFFSVSTCTEIQNQRTTPPPIDSRSRSFTPWFARWAKETAISWVAAWIVRLVSSSSTLYSEAGKMAIGQRDAMEFVLYGEWSDVQSRNIHLSFKQSISSPYPHRRYPKKVYRTCTVTGFEGTWKLNHIASVKWQVTVQSASQRIAPLPLITLKRVIRKVLEHMLPVAWQVLHPLHKGMQVPLTEESSRLGAIGVILVSNSFSGPTSNLGKKKLEPREWTITGMEKLNQVSKSCGKRKGHETIVMVASSTDVLIGIVR